MIKRRVISFSVLFFTFILVLMVVELMQFGTIVGFAINESALEFDFNIESVISYLIIFVCMFLIILSVIKIGRYNQAVNKLRGNHNSGLIKLDLK